MKQSPETVDSYISSFPKATRVLLYSVREAIRLVAPNADETIKYGIPTFLLHGNLVHFAAFKNHIGFYPGSSGIAKFKKELTVYKSGRGSIQFPIDKPIPLSLITTITRLRVKENIKKAKDKVTALSR